MKHFFIVSLLAIVLSKNSFSQAPEPTQQPSNLQFSNLTSYSLSLSFTPSIADGYLVLKSDRNISDVPTDGISYQQGQGLSTCKVMYSGPNTFINAREILESTKYYFKVFAFNGSGSSINYLQVSPLTDSIITPASNPGNYYSAIDSSAGTFIDDLHTLINAHNFISYSLYKYNIIPAIFERDTVGGQTVINCEYSNETTIYNAPFDFVALDYSREHVLCKSWMQSYSQFGSNITSQPEGADYFNLLLTRLAGVNQVRSNFSLGIPLSNIQSYKEFTYGQDADNNTVFQPRADRRGDAARAMFYEMVCYNGTNGNWGLNHLPSFATNQNQDVLKLWNQQDPPDKWERTKNEYIYSIQNNRNPFIDHAEWATCINFDSLIKTTLCGALTGIEEQGETLPFELYPNPVSEVLNLTLPRASEPSQVILTNAVGQIVLCKQFETNHVTIDMDNLSNGHYFVTITSSGSHYHKQFTLLK